MTNPPVTSLPMESKAGCCDGSKDKAKEQQGLRSTPKQVAKSPAPAEAPAKVSASCCGGGGGGHH